MNRLLPTILLVFCGFLLIAAPVNILDNGILDPGTSPVPEGWYYSKSVSGVAFPDGGPDNLPFVQFSTKPNEVIHEAELRQTGFELVEGEKYRVSCWIKTNDFKAHRACFIIIDFGWYHAFGVDIHTTNSDWTLFTKDITLGKSNSQEKGVESPTMKSPYSVLLYLSEYTGSIAIANVAVEPLTEKAIKGSTNTQMGLKQEKILVPLAPRVNAIPYGTQFLPLYWQAKTASTATATIDGQPAEISPLVKNKFRLTLSHCTTGPHKAVIKITTDNQTTEHTLDFGIAEPELPCPNEKRLNTFTTELLDKHLTAATTVDFVVPRRTWVYFKLVSDITPILTLNGDPNPLLVPESPRPEAQRHLNPGNYTLKFHEPTNGRLFIRTVPVLYKYAGIDGKTMDGIGGSDLDFHNKHVFGVFNTIGARGVPQKLRPYTASLGMECVDNCPPPSKKAYTPENVKEFVERLNSPNGCFADPSSQWTEFDEYFWNAPGGQLCGAYGIDKLVNPHGKNLFHWYGGAIGPNMTGIHHKVMSSFMNGGGGRGYIAYEVYFKPSKTEKLAFDNIKDTLSNSARMMNAFIPNSNGAFGYIFGNFHQLPILSVDWLPEVNYKYYLDMQFHYLATHPEFTGLALTGYWGFNYVNEEIARWSCELVRHYVLEGRTDRLSDKHGYTYILPHIANNDFDNGLEGWKTTGNVSTGHCPQFGALNELRWGASAHGNNFAILEGNADAPATLSQTARRLVPGKPYYLEFITADYDDTIAKKVNPRRFDIEVALPGTRQLHEFTYVDKRSKGRYGAVTAKTNYRYIRFVPEKDTLELTFTGSRKPGEKLLMNYVRIAPYFAE